MRGKDGRAFDFSRDFPHPAPRGAGFYPYYFLDNFQPPVLIS